MRGQGIQTRRLVGSNLVLPTNEPLHEDGETHQSLADHARPYHRAFRGFYVLFLDR